MTEDLHGWVIHPPSLFKGTHKICEETSTPAAPPPTVASTPVRAPARVPRHARAQRGDMRETCPPAAPSREPYLRAAAACCVRGARRELVVANLSSGVAGGRAAAPWQRHRAAALTVAVAPPACCARMRTGVPAAAIQRGSGHPTRISRRLRHLSLAVAQTMSATSLAHAARRRLRTCDCGERLGNSPRICGERVLPCHLRPAGGGRASCHQTHHDLILPCDMCEQEEQRAVLARCVVRLPRRHALARGGTHRYAKDSKSSNQRPACRDPRKVSQGR